MNWGWGWDVWLLVLRGKGAWLLINWVSEKALVEIS
jgi:hypothetical protein